MPRFVWVRLWNFVRLTRPLFLLGGVLLYALGALYAWKSGIGVSVTAYWHGQALVTAVQLMTHYANEYYDQETDRLNSAGRTWFSGGSGALVDGTVTPLLAQHLAYAMGLVAFMLLFGIWFRSPWSFALGLLSILSGWFYTAPPLALVRTGWGELSATVVVTILVPLISYTQQARYFPDFRLFWVLLPLAFVHWAMLISFQIPDIAADAQTGKRTLSVRLGKWRAFQMHHALLGLAVIWSVLLWIESNPVVRLAWIALPLALWQVAASSRYQRSSNLHAQWLTFRALALFALCVFLWIVGLAVG